MKFKRVLSFDISIFHPNKDFSQCLDKSNLFSDIGPIVHNVCTALNKKLKLRILSLVSNLLVRLKGVSLEDEKTPTLMYDQGSHGDWKLKIVKEK